MDEIIDVTEIKSVKKKSLKFKITIFLILLIIGLGTYLFYWYQSTAKVRLQAEQVVAQANGYQRLKDQITLESDRCKDFIVQKEGDFGGFEYCKSFVTWSSSILTQ